MADKESALNLPAINFDKSFFVDIVKNVMDELKANKSQSQPSPTGKIKHDTRNTSKQGQPTWDVDMIGVMVSCITKALTPVIVQTVQAAISSLVLPPPTPANSVPQAQVDENLKLKIGIDDANQYSRRDSVRINGLDEDPAESESDLVEKIVDIAKITGAEISDRDISIAHRLPIKIKGVRQVICKFTSRRAKIAFYYARMKLKDSDKGKGIFINEDLTKLRYKLMMEAKKVPGCRAITTNNGTIKVWVEGRLEGAYTINHPADLEQLGLTPDYKALGLQ